MLANSSTLRYNQFGNYVLNIHFPKAIGEEGCKMERSFVMIKPDGVQRGLIGEVISRFERRGLKLVGLKLLQPSQALAEQHYGAHREKPFFGRVVSFITSGPVVAMVLEGPDAIHVIRNTMGATKPAEAAPGTIRADYAVDIAYNIVHGSDSTESAEQEIALWFGEGGLLEYQRAIDPWLVEAPQN